MKMNSFTIFLLLLIVLVIIMLFSKCGSFTSLNKKESFVNFQNTATAGSSVYIPQYHSDSTRTVTLLYDNLFFDEKNGNLIEVDAPSVTSSANDNTGNGITKLYVISRKGDQLTSYSTLYNNKAIVANVNESKSASIPSLFSNYSYISMCANTDTYQVFYTSWDRDTYIHIMKIGAGANGTNIITYYFNTAGFVSSYSNYNANNYIAPYAKSPSLDNANKNNTFMTLPNYLGGNLSIYQITPFVFYDSKNGYVLIKKPSDNTYLAYNRSDSGSDVSPQDNASLNNIAGNINVFTVNDNNNGMVLVIAYNYNTVINVIVPQTNNKSYVLQTSVRFNGSNIVNSGPTPSDTSVPTSTPTSVPTCVPTSTPASSTSLTKASLTKDSSVCGDDLSCKWYWYFNTMAKTSNAPDYFKEDYFLKTEIVPPVCPTCPNCPSLGGPCTACGGSGGAGATVAPTPAPTSASPTSASPTSAAQTQGTTASPTSASPTTAAPTKGTTAAPTTASPTKGTTASPTTAAPTSASPTKGSTATNSNIARNSTNTPYVPTQSIINIPKHQFQNHTTNVQSVGQSSIGQSVGQTSIGQSVGQTSRNLQTVTNEPESGGTGPAYSTPASNFGDMGTSTPVDNYSQYGALQSKGCNYMPVTADFSAFRK